MSSVSLPSLEELRTTLIRRGIPARYAHRVTSELHDHADDIAANGNGSDNRLGEMSQLADEITHTYRRRTFAGRHPWLMLILLPSPLAVLACVGTMIVYFGSITLLAKCFIDPSLIREGAVASTFRIVAILLPTASCAAVAWFICRYARRAGYHWKYVLLACLPVLLLSCHTISQFRLAATTESKGHYLFGLILPFLRNNWTAYGWQQGVQALVPMLVIGWMMVREARKQPRLLVVATR